MKILAFYSKPLAALCRMILSPAEYADETAQNYKATTANRMAKHLQEAFSLTSKGKENKDFLFAGESGWMHPGESLYIYDSLRGFR